LNSSLSDVFLTSVFGGQLVTESGVWRLVPIIFWGALGIQRHHADLPGKRGRKNVAVEFANAEGDFWHVYCAPVPLKPVPPPAMAGVSGEQTPDP
jgi:hypothetical protein